MISYRVRGRILAVRAMGLDASQGKPVLQVDAAGIGGLSVVATVGEEAEPTHCKWLAHLPPQLYRDAPVRVSLHLCCADRILDEAAFWFSGSSRILEPPVPVADYGACATEALSIKREGPDFLFFPIIDWDYRQQRPQHLARCIAEAGHRVFYIGVHFVRYPGGGCRFRVVRQPAPNVFEVQLLVPQRIDNIYRGFTADQIEDLRDAILELHDAMRLAAPVAIVEFPSWGAIAEALPGCAVVYDCLDLIAGFDNVGGQALIDEERLLQTADLVVTTSQPLADRMAPTRQSTIIRNAARVEDFRGACGLGRPDAVPVVGYFGEIGDWFDASWLRAAAEHWPLAQFKLIGRAHQDVVDALDGLQNVHLVGEVPYLELPTAIADFTIGIVPFKLTPLIECVNPVKVYEYMAAGLPVVSAPLPEVVALAELVRIAHTAEEFCTQIGAALEDAADTDAANRRMRWAAGHNWPMRARRLTDALVTVWPKVSVIVLAHNQSHLTLASVHSVFAFSDYGNFEVIVVDNGSSDDTGTALQRFAGDARFRYIRLDENAGFAAGNNIGMKAATGDFLILLNNDTYVTKGWIRDLIRPLLLDPAIGLVGPLTNRIGNEQQVRIEYDNLRAMAAEARRVTRRYTRRLFDVRALGFFSVAMRRELFDTLGGLDESYGIGFFEDDDYCMRVAAAGYRIVVADDVFVHHQLSASFNAISPDRRNLLMERNRAIYEARWGPWPAHRYRDEPGFGA